MNTQASEEDLIDLVTGGFLGAGAYRKTFIYKLDPTKVIKRSISDTHRHSIIEYEVWESVQDDKKLSRWFAPVYAISDLGVWIVQARTKPIAKEDLPKKVPYIFTDLKPANWGWYNDHPVCHDYGSVMGRLVASCGNRMRVADWFGTTGY